MEKNTSPLTLSDFASWLIEYGDNPEWAEAYVKDVYLTDPDGCIPEEYAGDELLYSVRAKFWYPIRWLVERVVRKAKGKVAESRPQILIDAAYDGLTYVLVYLEDRILFQDSWKAWHFWWPDAAQFEAWTHEVYSAIAAKLK